MAHVEDSLLGKKTRYDSAYDPKLLFPIARAESRLKLGMTELPFQGEDWWTCYEFSWLQTNGLPVAALAHFYIPCDSVSIVESKSFKLYLNSFNQEKFESQEHVMTTLHRDLSAAAGADIRVRLERLPDATFPIQEAQQSYYCIDETPCSDAPFVYEPDSALLTLDSSGEMVEEALVSNLLRSNCPVTDQPDWGSVFIRYRGQKIDHEALLRYIVSFRQCQDFHEHCVERMFVDLKARCHCEELSVYARYTRRGGLDINPYRASSGMPEEASNIRTVRQ